MTWKDIHSLTLYKMQLVDLPGLPSLAPPTMMSRRRLKF